MAEKVALQGVPETLLWPLYNRAAFASRPGALLEDPKSVEIRNAIEYPFARHFGRPNEAHALRALDIGRGQSLAFGILFPLLSHLPGFIANKRPAIVVVRFGDGEIR